MYIWKNRGIYEMRRVRYQPKVNCTAGIEKKIEKMRSLSLCVYIYVCACDNISVRWKNSRFFFSLWLYYIQLNTCI